MLDSLLINHYSQLYSNENRDLLEQVERSAALHTSDPSMISDFGQGRLLSMISKLYQPQKILEIGTFVGYSAICMAEGLSEGGLILSLEANTDLKSIIDNNLALAGLNNNVEVIYGPALESISKLDLSTFDLFFIDAAKKEYEQYYECILADARSGAILIVDNVLWKGHVTDRKKKGIAKAMDLFNIKVRDDDRVSNFILPFRDGLNVITVK